MEHCSTTINPNQIDHHKMKLFAVGQKNCHKNYNLIIENFNLDNKISFMISSVKSLTQVYKNMVPVSFTLINGFQPFIC